MSRLLRSWRVAFALAVVISVGTTIIPVAPSPGRWEPDAAHAVRAESRWALDYLVVQPRTGDRISDSVYLALLEGEDRWTGAYFARQAAALDRAAARLDRKRDRDKQPLVAVTTAMLDHYQKVIAAGGQGATAFELLIQDQIGPNLREEALKKIDLMDMNK